MRKFPAGLFYHLGTALEKVHKKIQEIIDAQADVDKTIEKLNRPWNRLFYQGAISRTKLGLEKTNIPRQEMLDALGQVYGELSKLAQQSGLLRTSKKAAAYAKLVEDRQFTLSDTQTSATELNWLIESELRDEVCYILESDGKRILQQGKQDWAAVAAKLPDVTIYAERAAMALAFDDYTGAVFHLMQVMECAFDAIAGKLGITISRRQWDPLLKDFQKDLEKKYGAHWENKEPRLTSVLADLRSVKNAWRNNISHKDELAVDKFYEPKTATKIYAAVLAFMDNLVSLLDQPIP